MRKTWLVILVGMMAGIAIAVPEGTYSTGENDPIEIATSADWLELIATPNDWNESVLVTADIDFTGVTLTTIGNSTTAFSGTIDGDDHIFSNCVMNTPGVDNDVALVGTSTGTVKDLVVTNAVVTGGNNANPGLSSYTGVIVAQNQYASLIDNCTLNNCTVTLTQAAALPSYVGMISGANHGTVSNSEVNGGSVKADRTAGASYLFMGGVVGYQTGGAGGGAVGKVDTCTSTAYVGSLAGTSTGFKQIIVGGIAGKAAASAAGDNNILNSTHTGTISYTALTSDDAVSSGILVGGVVGQSVSVDVQNCSHTGAITVTSVDVAETRAGGVIGEMNGATSLLDRCYSDSAIRVGYKATIKPYVGGVVGYTGSAGCIISDSYARGSFYDLSAGSNTIALGYWGGIVGYALYANAYNNCYAALSAYVDGDAATTTIRVGGAAGSAAASPVFTDCFWDVTTSGIAVSYGGGTIGTEATGKTTTEMQTLATFTATDHVWDFVTAGSRDWKMADIIDGTPASGDVYGMYPILDWQTFPYGGGLGTTGNPYEINTSIQWKYAYGNIDERSAATPYYQIGRDFTLATEFMILKNTGSSKSTPFGSGGAVYGN